MIKMLILIFIAVVISGCGTTGKKGVKLDGDFDEIENKDFKAIPEIEYIEHEDLFVDEVSQTDALSKESLARLPEPKLQRAGKVDNPISKGISLCYQRRFTEAFKLLDAAYFKYKGHPSYWNQVGTCYFLQGWNRKAFLFYNKARDLNQKYAPAINNLGVIYQREGNEQKAMAAFDKASEINSFSMTPMFNKAQIFLKYGFIEKARRIFEVLHKKNNSDVDVINGLALCQLFNGNTGNALSYYSMLDDDTLEIPHIGINYALALKMSGRARDAVSVFEDINRKKIGNMKVHYTRVGKYLGVK